MTNAFPQGSMSVGNIVSTGFRLYLANFLRYGLISLRASLWLLLPWVVAIAFILFAMVSGLQIAQMDGLLAIAIPVLFVLLIFCSAQSMAEFAAIVRLAYQQLNDAPESERDALRFTRSRKWSLLGASVLRALLFFGAYIAVLLAMLVLAGIFAFLGTQLSGGTPNTFFAILGGFLGLVALIAIVLLFLRLGIGFMLIVPPLAVEENSHASASLSRSWELTRKSMGHCLAVSFVALLVSLPISIVVFGLSQAVNSLISGFGSALDPTFQILIFLISYIIGILSGIVTAPFWQVVFATLYWDLRNRSEGMDLKFSR